MAFYGCTSLEKISLSKNIERIEERAFENTGLYNNVDNWDGCALYIDNCLVTVDRYTAKGDFVVKEGTTIIADKGIYYYKTYDNSRIIGIDMFLEDLEQNRLISYSLIKEESFSIQNQLKETAVSSSQTNIS
jgi:hypothetical protein